MPLRARGIYYTRYSKKYKFRGPHTAKLHQKNTVHKARVPILNAQCTTFTPERVRPSYLANIKPPWGLSIEVLTVVELNFKPQTGQAGHETTVLYIKYTHLKTQRDAVVPARFLLGCCSGTAFI